MDRVHRLRMVWGGVILAAGVWCGCGTPDGASAYFGNYKSTANVYVAPVPCEVERVAIMPFKAPTELIGSSVSDLFVTELLRAGRYQLVERSQMRNVLNEAEVALSGISDSRAVELGNLLGADGVVIGTVDEYSATAYRGRSIPVVGVSVRLIDCKTGKVMWSADSAEKAASDAVSLPQHARKVIHGLVAGLYQTWGVQRKVAKSSGVGAAVRPDAPVLVAPVRPAAPPAPPAGVRVSDLGLRRAEINWTPAAGGLEVRIERAENPQGPFTMVGTAGAAKGRFVDERGLQDGTSYYYRLVAQADGGAASSPSPVVETLTAPPPEPVRVVKAASGGVRVVALSWAASPEDSVTEYRILRADGEEMLFKEVARVKGRDTTTYVDGGREPGRLADQAAYRYRVAAVNSVGAVGAESDPVNATTRGAPPVIMGLQAGSARPREVPLTWTRSTDEKTAGYEVWRAKDGGAFEKIETIENSETTSHVDRGGERDAADLGRLEDGTTYAYHVLAFNIGGVRSAPCEPVKAKTKDAPAVPAAVTAAGGEPRQVTLAWPANSEPDIAAYVVEYRPADSTRFRGAQTVAAEAGRTAYTSVRNGLEDGAGYVFRVKAVDADRLESAWSATAEAVTKPLPGAPTELKVAAAAGAGEGALLTWTPPAVSDIVRYRVWKKGLLGADLLGETGTPDFQLTAAVLAKKIKVQVSAVDKDGLESERSGVVDAPANPQP